MKSPSPTRVVIVDDSLLIRHLLQEIVDDADDLQVVGMAENALAAREIIRATNPDVVTLDIEMPGMSGLEFLEKLMRLKPTPVVMVSSLTTDGADATFRALEMGAVDFHPKPVFNVRSQLTEYAEEIREKIRAAARSRVGGTRPHAEPGYKPPAGKIMAYGQELLLIGASTGGTEAIREVLQGLTPPTPPVLIVQHMPPGFTRSYAQRLDKICPLRVTEATGGMPVLPGHAYIAPGDSHLRLGEMAGRPVCLLSNAAQVNRHRPSVDVLFESVASLPIARRTSAALLTGMGRDGAAGLLSLRQAGSHTVAQNEESCVVFGMPREAILLGAAEEILPLDAIAGAFLNCRR